MDPYSIKDLNNIFARVRNRAIENKVVKECRWDIIPKKGRKGFDGLLECTSNYKFIHINNMKFNAAILALMGIKLTDLHYSGEDKYSRIKFTTTDLYFSREDATNERFALAMENVDYVINLLRVIEHGSPHLWQRLSDNIHLVISFRNKEDFNECITKLESDLKKYGSKETFNLNVLKFFEQIHWIKVLDEGDLTFQFLISEQDHKKERELLLTYLSKDFEVVVENQIIRMKSK